MSGILAIVLDLCIWHAQATGRIWFFSVGCVGGRLIGFVYGYWRNSSLPYLDPGSIDVKIICVSRLVLRFLLLWYTVGLVSLGCVQQFHTVVLYPFLFVCISFGMHCISLFL